MNLALNTIYRLFFCLGMLFACSGGALLAQKTQGELKKEAALNFNKGNYDKALVLYKRIAQKEKENPDWKYRQALCLYHLNKYETALPFFDAYLKYKKHEDKALFYTARALHHCEQWPKALQLYKLYLKVSPQKSEDRAEVKKLLLQCISAQKAANTGLPALVINPGDSLNSKADELLPLQNSRSSDQLFFSSNRNGNFDIYYALQAQANWQKAKPLSKRYNSEEDEILNAFPDEAYQILYQKDNQAFVDNYLDESEEKLAVPFAPEMLEGSWNGDYYYYSDSLLLFVSDREGGYGGLDVYYSIRNAKGIWEKPLNMGSSVNSGHNERAPFLAADGTTIYFSSDRPESSGGYDVFKSVFSATTRLWSKIEALGKPINSAGDELFFRPNLNGSSAFLSAVRNAGQGGFDLYIVYFRQSLSGQIRTKNSVDFIVLMQRANAARDSLKTNPIIVQDTANSLVLQSFLYDVNSGKWEQGAERELETLGQLMLKNPTMKVLLTAHSDNTQALNSSLFLSVQQAERAAEGLIKKGIAPARILLRGCAGQYPEAKNKRFDGSPDLAGRRLNNRLDIDIYNLENFSTRIETKRQMISSVMKDTLADNYNQRLQGLSYKVQLVNTPTLYVHPVLDQIRDVAAEKIPMTPDITYCIGMAKNFDAILLVHETAIEMGFAGAKIVPYIDGFPIDKETAKLLQEEYVDLKKYLSCKK